MEIEAGTQDRTLTSRDSDIDAAGIASYVAALAFSRIALPPQLSDAVRRSIEALAERERELSGPANADLAVRDAKEKREKDADDHKEQQVGWIQHEQQREREQWARSSHSFGATTMTGAEWKLLSDELKGDGALRQWLVARLMKDGRTEEEAKQKAGEIADIAAIMATPESQRTPAEQAKMKKAEQDPEFQRVLPELAEFQRTGGAALSQRQSLDTDQIASTQARSEIFASAPDLKTHHRAALAAAEPLDVTRPAVAATAPDRPAPMPAASAGLDL